MRLIYAALVLALTVVPARAADTAILPDKPEPVAKVRTADKEFWIETGGMAAAWTADTITTHNSFAENPAHHEVGELFTGTRSTAKVMGAWALIDIAAGITAYEWKGHITNRYLHPLWRLPVLLRSEDHIQSGIGNLTLPVEAGKQPARTLPVTLPGKIKL